MKFLGTLLAAVIVLAAVPVGAEDFDPYLSQKAAEYTAWLQQWHSTGLGGVSDVVFTDESRTELYRTWGSGDSGDWTGTYLVTQAIRYAITGEQNARDEVLRIANYMHILKDITGDPGYLARYAAPNQAPWNVESQGADNFYLGEGVYDGYFWLGHNVRDKYITWFWGLSWAYETVDDADMRETIRQDFRDVILTLKDNDWTIIDPWGGVYSAAKILPDIRLSILVQAATVIDEPEFWQLLDEEYEKNEAALWLTTIAFFNRYMDYYAFINNYSNSQPLYRWWPDRRRLEHLFQVWNVNVRAWSNDGHNPFFDAVYYQVCLRLGTCEADELTAIEADAYQSLVDMNEAPNYQRAYTCTEMPLDPFSVWADEFLTNNPWIGELTGIDIDPQTLDAHEVWDRCWDSVLWERSPYHTSCNYGDDPTHTTHGVDYLIGYWLGVYYGILPGDGPYGDDDPTDDDTVDDDVVDDDTADDDAADDDSVDDDAVDDDTVDDDTADDDLSDDDAVDDDAAADDDSSDDDADDDDNDDGGCGC